LKDQLLPRDAYGRVVSESVQTQSGPAVQQNNNWGQDCCGKNSINDLDGGVLASAKHSRGGVKAQLTYAADLASSGSGGLNQIPAPWNALIDPEGDPTQEIKIELPYAPGDPRLWTGGTIQPIFVQLGADALTGKPSEVAQGEGETPQVLAQFAWDSSGRLIGATDFTGSPEQTTHFHNDWLTGNANLTTGPGAGEQTAYNHAPGFSRAAAEIEETPCQQWFLRGPHGQVKWVVDDDGGVGNYIGYGSAGNRIIIDGDWPPHIMPIFLDHDVLPLPAFGQLKLAAGTAQDMTQQLGAVDGAGVSGLAGQGASANPDTAPGGNAAYLQPALAGGLIPGHGKGWIPLGGWSEIEGEAFRDWIDREKNPIPGFDPWKGVLGDTAPPQAPPAVQDAATDADFRLAGMWREQEYYGAKPGAQQGSAWVDDQRNARLPLWCYRPVGDNPLSDWVDREMHPEKYWNERPAVPWPFPSRGPRPLLPNPDSGGNEDGGTTEPRDPADDALQNAYNAQDPFNWDTFWKMMNDPLWGTVIMLPLGLLKGGLTIGGRLVFAGASKIGLVAKVAEYADDAVRWAGRGLEALAGVIDRALGGGGLKLAYAAAENGISTGVKLLDDLGNGILSFAKSGGLGPNLKGQLGEEAGKAAYTAAHEGDDIVWQKAIDLATGGKVRPDGMNLTTNAWIEFKNVLVQGYTKQVRTYEAGAKAAETTLSLGIQEGAHITKPLLEAAKNGIIKIFRYLIK
jgi:hypothetical protein